MSFTNATRIEALIGQSSADFHQALDNDAIVNAASAANDFITDSGVASSETSDVVKSAADRYALALLIDGMLIRQAMRGKSQATGSLRIMAQDLRANAIEALSPYITRSRSNTKIANNRNWAYDRGGPLRRGTEAGRFKRTTR